MEEKIKIELCGGKMPVKAHCMDAAYDVYSREDIFIAPYMRCAVPLGFKIQLPKHLGVVIQPRSGMSLKGMACKAKTQNGDIDIRIDADVFLGLIDSGYTGEVHAILRIGCGSTHELCGMKNHGVYIPKDTKIAQMRIVNIPEVQLYESTIDKNTERGNNGFNSTGV